MRRRMGIVVVAIAALFLAGCASTASKEPMYRPTFDYKPVTEAAPSAENLTFALIKPSFSENEPWTKVDPFLRFSKNLGLDFQEALIARGFNVRGPYGSYDEMTFPDKKACYFTLQPLLDVTVSVTGSNETVLMLLAPNQFKRKGTITVSGRLSLAANESLSNERMWFKSIDIEPTTVSWVGENRYKTAPPPTFVDYSDPGIARALGRPLETIYDKLMQSAWDYLNPEEFALLKKQAEELRAKKVY